MDLPKPKSFSGGCRSGVFLLACFILMSPLTVQGKLVFLPQFQEARVYHGAPPGVYVTTVRAHHELAEDDLQPITYKLLKGSDNFEVNELNGRVTTLSVANKTVNDTYNILVVAVSGGATESQQISVRVTQYNRYSPQFVLPRYRMEIPSTEAVGTVLMRVQAVDDDVDTYNSEVYYFLAPKSSLGGEVGPHSSVIGTYNLNNVTGVVEEDSQYFLINSSSGELSVQLSLEGKIGHLAFNVVVIDGGSPYRWNSTSVIVAVKSITEPMNITVDDVTETQVRVCWQRPLQGSVHGYMIRYREVWRDLVVYNGTFLREDTLNVTIYRAEPRYCAWLKHLHPNSKFELRMYGWNSEEIGLGSSVVLFATAEPRCPSEDVCGNGTCHLSSDYNYVASSMSENYVCECQSGYYGLHCERFDPCSAFPCHNLGTCVNVSDEAFECHCVTGFYGDDCSRFDPCANTNVVVCHNGGSCHSIGSHSYTCKCLHGYYGRGCEHLDPCSLVPAPCLNGATCHNTSDSEFRCLCHPGFTGKNCESNIDDCLSSPCLHGTCADGIHSFSCKCDAGFEGALCEQEIDECLSAPCQNGGNCEDGVNAFGCHCPLGYKGETCEIDVDECSSGPCLNGALCRDGTASFTCLCATGFEGLHCESLATCPGGIVSTAKGDMNFNSTSHGTNATAQCPYGPTEIFATRQCVLTESGRVTWSEVETLKCREQGFQMAESITDRLRLMTSDPAQLDEMKMKTVVDNIERIFNYALKDEKIAKGMVSVISNVLDANDTMFLKRDENSASVRLSRVLDRFVNEVEPLNGSMSIATDNLKLSVLTMHSLGREDNSDAFIKLEGVSPKPLASYDEVESSSKVVSIPVVNLSTQVYDSTENDTGVRIQFVAYANSKMFRESSKSAMDRYTPVGVPVLSVSIANTTVDNTSDVLNFTIEKLLYGSWICAFWNESGYGSWSTDGLSAEQTETEVTCTSSHMTAFSILLDPNPSPVDEANQRALSIISYIGSGLSIIGLSLTVMTYSLFRCLNRDRSGRILLNLCIAMLLLNVAFLAGSVRPRTLSSEVGLHLCRGIAVLTHYLILTTLSWMTVEAVNMYQLLIHVFATSETRFLLKRCLIAWGVPAIVVGVTAAFDLKHYDANNEYCMLSPLDPYVYYITFLGPCCLLLIINMIVFVLVTRVLFQPRGSIGVASKSRLVTFAQVRGAFTVMTLLGITWVFGALALGPARTLFQYIFCVLNSLQGFLLFMVRCLQYPEARSAWSLFLRTGTLKKHRGTRITTSSNSQVKLSLSSGGTGNHNSEYTFRKYSNGCNLASESSLLPKKSATNELSGGVAQSWVYGGCVGTGNVVEDTSAKRSNQLSGKGNAGSEFSDAKEGRDTHWEYLSLNGATSRKGSNQIPETKPMGHFSAESIGFPFIEDDGGGSGESDMNGEKEAATELMDKMPKENPKKFLKCNPGIKLHNGSQTDLGYSSAEQSPSWRRNRLRQMLGTDSLTSSESSSNTSEPTRSLTMQN